MSELSAAIIGGVVVYTLSQYIQKFILETLIDYKKTITEISHIILLNQSKIFNGGPNEEELKDKLHFLSARLRAFTKLIPFYSFLQKIKIFGLPHRENILSASHCLNQIGYGVVDIGVPKDDVIEQNSEAVEKLRILLNIETTYRKPIDKP